MFRFSISLALLAACCLAHAADLPKDISKERRDAFIKRHADSLATERPKLLTQIEDAKTLAKFAATEKEGKKKLAEAANRLATIEREPWRIRGVAVIGEAKRLTQGDIGIISPLGRYIGEKTEDGVVIDGILDTGTPKTTVKLLIASPFEIPKPVQPKSKKDKPDYTFEISRSRLWYVAGFVNRNGKQMPVLYELKINPEEYATP